MAGDSDRSMTLAEALFEALPLPALIHGTKHLTAVNAAGRQLLDAQQAEDLNGLPMPSLLHPDSLEAGELRGQYMSVHGRRLFGVPVKLVSLAGTPVNLTVATSSFALGDQTLIVAARCEAPGDPCPAGRRASLPEAHQDTPPREAALDAFPLPVVAISEFRIAYVNHAACTVLKAPGPSALIGDFVTSVVHPEMRTGLFDLFRLALGRGEYRQERAAKALAVDGTVINARGRGAFTSHGGRRYGMWVVTGIDAMSSSPPM